MPNTWSAMMPVEQRRPSVSPGALLPLSTILLIAAYRLAPHPWNVAPVGALFALSGLYLGKGWRAWALPFAAVIASDAFVYLRWDGSLLHPERIGDYAAFALILLTTQWCAARGAALRIGGVLAAPVLFYLISNFAVWLSGAPAYPYTLAGLADCYVA